MGTLIYIFAGWTIYAAMKHPYFSNPMIYLPLVLMGIDKIYKREKPWLFIWATAVSAMSNFYFFYMICIFMFIYAAFRYFGIFSERSVKDVLGWLVKFIGYYAVALMIAAVIFSSGDHDDFLVRTGFRLRIMCLFYMIKFIMRSIWVI